MQRRWTAGALTALVATLGLALTGTALGEEAGASRARALVDQGAAQYRSVGSERETLDTVVVAAPQKDVFTVDDVQRMIREGGRGITHKQAVRYVRYAEGRRDKSYVRFSAPPEDAGTEFLVWREPESAADNQWLFMPALAKVRRVPVSSTATFMGTDLTYEDVREQAGENVDRYTYADSRTEVWEGHACHVVTAKPAATTQSAYASRKLWIDQEHAFTWKIEYYDERGTTVKMLRNTAISEVRHGVYRPSLTQMRDLRVDEVTLIWFSEREVALDVPDEMFAVDRLGTR